MKWLTLQEIKAHLRIDSDCCIEDSLLTRYGASAEATILQLTRRTVEELIAMNPLQDGEVPPDIWEASLLLVEHSYQNRGAVSPISMYTVPYGFDMKIRPYMRLTSDDGDEGGGGASRTEMQALWKAVERLETEKQDKLEFATNGDIDAVFGN